MPLQHLIATRYVLPLREGGSLPAIVDTDVAGQYVVKFRGAGQGPKALVAETIAAGLAQAVSLPIPTPAVVKLAEGFGMGEPNPEIQDLLRGSTGKNFGIAYLPGAIGFDPVADKANVDASLAASIVWFDALITNVDRTPRNPNLLVWQEKLWLIDHGASLYFHHSSQDWAGRSQDRFPLIEQHILLGKAGSLPEIDERLRPLLTEAVLTAVIDSIPADWLSGDVAVVRKAYVVYLQERLNGPRPWLEEAERVRSHL